MNPRMSIYKIEDDEITYATREDIDNCDWQNACIAIAEDATQARRLAIAFDNAVINADNVGTTEFGVIKALIPTQRVN